MTNRPIPFSIVRGTATLLGQDPRFLGEHPLFTLYQDVPLWCIRAKAIKQLAAPLVSSGPAANLVVCRTSDDAVAAVVLLAQPNFPVPEGIPVVRANSPQSVLAPVREALETAEDPSFVPAGYLPAVPVRQLLNCTNAMAFQRLQRARLVSCAGPTDSATEYGKCSGIFLHWDFSAGKYENEPAVWQRSTRLFWEAVYPFSTESDCTVPLADRLARARRGIPSDNRALSLLTVQLMHLLDTTATNLAPDIEAMEDVLDIYNHICNRFHRACNAEEFTFRQLFEAASWLYKESQGKEDPDTITYLYALLNYAVAAIMELPKYGRPQYEPLPATERISLTKRLAAAKSGPNVVSLLDTTLAAYYEAAAMYTKSTYPRWIYRRTLERQLNPKNENRYTFGSLASGAKKYLSEEPDGFSPDLRLVYNLLVEPFFPSPDLICA